jgi:hypothetical protein
MNVYTTPHCTILALCVLALLSLSSPERAVSQPPNDPNQGAGFDTVLLHWEDYGKIADLIYESPAWTSTGPSTEEEWKLLAEISAALQVLEPRDMEIALIVYMNKHCAGLRRFEKDPDPRTRPLLILSVMFDKAVPLVGQQELKAMQEHYGVQTGGAFTWKQIQPLGSWDDLDQLPVQWADNKHPELIAIRVAQSSGSTGPPKRPYQPHAEYQCFVRAYPFRKDFKPILEIPGRQWRTLWKHLCEEKLMRMREDAKVD